MLNAILNPLKVVGRYLFNDGATERTNVLPETLSQPVAIILQQQERDHQILETMSNSLARIDDSLARMDNSLATMINLLVTMSNSLETVANSLKAKDHALLENVDKSQAESKQVVQSASTISLETVSNSLETVIRSQAESKQIVQSLSGILLGILDSDINLDLDLVENQSDTKITRLDFKKYLHDAHGLPQSGQLKDFIAAGIISDSEASSFQDTLQITETREHFSFDMATGRVLPSTIVTAAHI